MAPTQAPTPPTPSSRTKDQLYIEPLKKEEVETYQRVRHASFADTINRILYKAPTISRETQDKILEKMRKDIDEGTLFMVCKDRATGEIIAGARWRYVCHKPSPPSPEEGAKDGAEKPENDKAQHAGVNGIENGHPQPDWPADRPALRSWKQVDADLTIPEPFPETNLPAFHTTFSLFNKNKRHILANRPYLVLDTLVTHPEHHRRGAGSLLVQWGAEFADAKNVEAYLEASLMGAPLYARWGFEEVESVDMEGKPTGSPRMRAEYEIGEGFAQAGEGGTESLGGRREAQEFICMRRPAKWEREAREQQ